MPSLQLFVAFCSLNWKSNSDLQVPSVLRGHLRTLARQSSATWLPVSWIPHGFSASARKECCDLWHLVDEIAYQLSTFCWLEASYRFCIQSNRMKIRCGAAAGVTESWGHLSVSKTINTACLVLGFFLLDSLRAFTLSDASPTLMDYGKYFTLGNIVFRNLLVIYRHNHIYFFSRKCVIG